MLRKFAVFAANRGWLAVHRAGGSGRQYHCRLFRRRYFLQVK